jgi:hypothetical protein
VSYGVGILDEGKWIVAAGGKEADALVDAIGTLPILKCLEDGRPVYAIDLRAVLEPDGNVVCLKPTESEARAIAGKRKGRRVVLARLVPETVAGSVAKKLAAEQG